MVCAQRIPTPPCCARSPARCCSCSHTAASPLPRLQPPPNLTNTPSSPYKRRTKELKPKHTLQPTALPPEHTHHSRAIDGSARPTQLALTNPKPKPASPKTRRSTTARDAQPCTRPTRSHSEMPTASKAGALARTPRHQKRDRGSVQTQPPKPTAKAARRCPRGSAAATTAPRRPGPASTEKVKGKQPYSARTTAVLIKITT